MDHLPLPTCSWRGVTPCRNCDVIGKERGAFRPPPFSFCSPWSASRTGLGQSGPRACSSDDPHLPKIAFAPFYQEENRTSVRVQRQAPCACVPVFGVVYKAHSLKIAPHPRVDLRGQVYSIGPHCSGQISWTRAGCLSKLSPGVRSGWCE